MGLVALAVVLAIIGIAVGQLHGAHHIEVEHKPTIALGEKIVFHRAFEVALTESQLVGHPRKEGLVVGRLETFVRKLHQNHQSTPVALVESLVRLDPAQGSPAACLHPLAAHLRPAAHGTHDLCVYFAETAVAVGQEPPAVGRLPVVQVLVAAQLHAHGASVAERGRAPHTPAGGHGIQGQGRKTQDQCHEYLFHLYF